MSGIPQEFADLFDRSLVAHFATNDPDGTPYVRPVWIDYDDGDGRIVVNSERGRRKERNARRDPQVSVSVIDPQRTYRFVSVQGEVETITEDGAAEHIDELSRQYLGIEEWPDHDESVTRVKIRIRPVDIVTSDST